MKLSTRMRYPYDHCAAPYLRSWHWGQIGSIIPDPLCLAASGFPHAGRPPARPMTGVGFYKGPHLMMDNATWYRAMASFCRQRAKMEDENEQFWLTEADGWVKRLSSKSVDTPQKEAGNAPSHWVTS